MEKEVETASKVADPELSGSAHSYKEAVYDLLENFFEWLSTHQGIAILLIILVLGIMVWLLLRAKKYRRQAENEAYLQKKEIGKKDTLIEEQENKLTNLQKKMGDQQGVASEAMLRTIRTLTGYDAEQLPIFFKSLTQSGENPLHIADNEAISASPDQYFEGDSDDYGEISDSKENVASTEDDRGDDSSYENGANEKLASGDDFSETGEATEKLESVGDSLENGAAKEEIASDSDASEENDSKKEKLAPNDSPEDASDTNKPVDV